MRARILRTFEAAHLLEDHPGQCKNVHGHTYTLVVEYFELIEGLREGISIDFSTLKKVTDEIISEYDHAFVYGHLGNVNDSIWESINFYHLKTKQLEGRSTAENMILDIVKSLQAKLGKNHVARVELSEGLNNTIIWNFNEDSEGFWR